MKTDLFQSCGHCWVFQICWHIECSTFTASSFRIWNSSTEIPSPPLALFIVMFSKAHLTSLPGYLGLGDWSHHRDYLGHEDLFCSSFVGFPGGSEVKVSACNAGGLGSIPGSGRSPGEGNGNPLQYSCVENPMDGGAWWATVHGVAKSWTRLSDLTHSLAHSTNSASQLHKLETVIKVLRLY